MSQQAKKEQVIKLREAGLSFGDISKQLGISRSTISSICQRASEQQKQRCKQCGVLLKQTAGHRQRIFCSDKCRKEWWKNNESHHLINNKDTCLICGKEFIYHESRHRKYCSLSCAYKKKIKDGGNNEK